MISEGLEGSALRRPWTRHDETNPAMVKMAAASKALLAQAERLARKRAQPATTGHLLLALYQRGAPGALLSEQGVAESALLQALGRDWEEHPNTLGLVLERAERTAAAAHARAADAGLCCLLALAREPRSVGYGCLELLGVQPTALQRVLRAALEGGTRAVRASHAAPPRALALSSRAPAQVRPRRLPRALSAQQRLADETESRRARERAERRSQNSEDAVATPCYEPPATAPAPAPAAPPEPRLALPPAARNRSSSSRPAAAASHGALDPERFPLLCALGRDLSAEAAQGLIDPVLGREAEIEQVLDVLARRRANNPILVGPPGVGKTAVALGVALVLARGRARGLDGRRVIELSASALLSGTGVRGALSERLQGLQQEIARAQGRLVVFIDEIHGVIGADEGADSLAQGLKAVLARGELPCIGATTEAEYRRIFERDAALARRFTRIEVGEPSPEAAFAILRGLSPEYERHHGVSYDPSALRAAVDLSVRFMSERHLPDKAIAVIDQAAARARRRGRARVDLEAVAEVVSEHCAVPLERLLLRDGEALLALESHLERRVVGQPEAGAAIADALRKGAAGFRGARPLGTFLLLGPTGVGKTEMAKAIAELLFPGSEMTRFDMSELSEPHAVARLLGAPPGYVGHEDGGQLTEAVRARPYQLVLLDEVEKAHREVLLALLPLLDEGRLTDGRGRTVDFTNTVIVMTSNLGVEAASERGRVGFGAGDSQGAAREHGRKAATLAAARRALPPELWNRIDEPLCFTPLDRGAVAEIAHRMCCAVVALMRREHGVAVQVEASAIDALIAAGGYDPELGARPMRRTVGRLLEARLARALLAGEFARGDAVVARGQDAQIVLERGQPVLDAAE